MKIPRFTFLFVSLLFFSAQADTLVLKNGLTLEGKYKGGSETSIKFETSGAVQEVAVSEIKSLTFSEPPVTSAAAKAPVTPAVPAAAAVGTAKMSAAPSGTEVPAGTKLMIKTSEDVTTASHQAGSVFKATLETDLVYNNMLIASKGSEIYGKVLESVGGRRIGNQRIVVSFDKISINGQFVEMDTDDVGAEGGRGGAARAVGAGALIGAAAGDAGKGAAVGAGLALLAGGKHIRVPAGSVVEVSIKQAIKVP
jgi:hypothetical protein